MTSPDRFTPPNGNPVDVEANRIQGLFANGLRDPGGALLGPIVEGIGQALAGAAGAGFERIRDAFHDRLSDDDSPAFQRLADAIFGLVTPREGSPLAGLADNQSSLLHELELLDGVRGYGSAYMSRNINTSGMGNNERWLPFDAQLGPMKGTHLGVDSEDPVQCGIVLEEPGLWTVSVLAHTRATLATPGFGVPDNSQVYLGVYRIDSAGVWRIWREVSLIVNNGNREASITGSVPVVIPDDEFGYGLGAYCWSSRWRWWSGGTQYSRLSAVKHDNRVENPGEATVPDE